MKLAMSMAPLGNAPAVQVCFWAVNYLILHIIAPKLSVVIVPLGVALPSCMRAIALLTLLEQLPAYIREQHKFVFTEKAPLLMDFVCAAVGQKMWFEGTRNVLVEFAKQRFYQKGMVFVDVKCLRFPQAGDINYKKDADLPFVGVYVPGCHESLVATANPIIVIFQVSHMSMCQRFVCM